MTAKGIRMDKEPIGRVRFNPNQSTSVTSADKPEKTLDMNYVQVKESEMKGLTVKEFKSILAHEAMHTQIDAYDTFDVQAANARTADHAAARTYGGKTLSHALGEMQRGEVPHDPLHKREDEAIKTNPGSAVGGGWRAGPSRLFCHTNFLPGHSDNPG